MDSVIVPCLTSPAGPTTVLHLQPEAEGLSSVLAKRDGTEAFNPLQNVLCVFTRPRASFPPDLERSREWRLICMRTGLWA